jgi:hypothetical protein
MLEMDKFFFTNLHIEPARATQDVEVMVFSTQKNRLIMCNNN